MHRVIIRMTLVVFQKNELLSCLLTFCAKSFWGNMMSCCWDPADRSRCGCCCWTNFFRSPSLLLIRLDSSRHRGGVIDGESVQLLLLARAIFCCFSLGVGGNGVVAILGNGRGHDSNSLWSWSASVQYKSKSPSPALNLLRKHNAVRSVTIIRLGLLYDRHCL